MKFIADENIFEPIIDYLKDEGNEVVNVRKDGYSGKPDDFIYEMAVNKKLIILTMDKDFSRMLRFPPDKCGGIIVVKLYKMTVNKAVEIFKRYFKTIDSEHLKHRLIIITPEGIRYRSRFT